MKILIIILAALLIGSGYSSHQRIYKELAVKYLQSMVHNPESIDTVNWGKPKAVYRSFVISEVNKDFKKSSDSLKKEGAYELYRAKHTSNKDSIKLYLKLTKVDET